MNTQKIKENIDKIQEKIHNACLKTGRKADEITMIAVSKTIAPETVKSAIDAGIKIFGENYLPEGSQKAALFQEAEWHLIGHLQSNKIKLALKNFILLQSIDSISLAEKINNAAKKENLCKDILLQIHYGNESTKSGFSPFEAKEAFNKISLLDNLQIKGLMTIPPLVNTAQENRKYFREMKELSEKLFPQDNAILSMGMTDDFEIAIEEGSTMVRIGRAIFGERKK